MTKVRSYSLIPFDPSTEPTKVQWAYLAGFLDGEGCISAPARANGISHGAQITAKQKYSDPLDWIMATFNVGHISGKKIHRWKVSQRQQVLWLLENILPYLTLKRDQAEAAIELCQRPLSSERSLELSQLLHSLKKRS